MSKLNRKAIEVLDVCLASESPEVKAKVYQIIELSELDPTDPMFLVLALTGQMRVLLETAPEELSKLLQEWKEQSDTSLKSIQQAVTQISSTQKQQAENIKRTLEQVSLGYASEMKEVGQATVSAIAEANSETLSYAQSTAQGAKEVASAVISLKTV